MEDHYDSNKPFKRWIWYNNNPFSSWKSACVAAREWAIQKQSPVKILTFNASNTSHRQFRLMWLKIWPNEHVYLAEMGNELKELAEKNARENAVKRKKSRNHRCSADEYFTEEEYFIDPEEEDREWERFLAFETERDDIVAEGQNYMDEYARNEEEGWPYDD